MIIFVNDNRYIGYTQVLYYGGFVFVEGVKTQSEVLVVTYAREHLWCLSNWAAFYFLKMW